MEYPDPRCSEYEKMAANPDKMGGHGQPNGRPMEAPQERDSNHPMGTDKRAGLPTDRVVLG